MFFQHQQHDFNLHNLHTHTSVGERHETPLPPTTILMIINFTRVRSLISKTNKANITHSECKCGRNGLHRIIILLPNDNKNQSKPEKRTATKKENEENLE